MYDDYHIILASKSPRRRDLLESIGIPFEARGISIREDYPESMNPTDVAAYLSEQKSNVFGTLDSNKTVVITSDTIVVCDDKILRKPQNMEEGFSMLRELSGRTHVVITGVTLMSITKQVSFSETTTVSFEQHSDEELLAYLENFKPFDKAGAYGIQDNLEPDGRRTGPLKISVVEGSYYNVMGLPVEILQGKLDSFIKDLATTQ